MTMRFFGASTTAFIAAAILYSSPTWAVYSLNGDGTLTDSTSSLVWDTCHLGQTGTACTGTAGMYSWAGAQSAATTLNLAGQHGFNDWCVPTFAINNALWTNQTTTLPNNIADWHWTSDIIGGGQWVTSFANGANSAIVTSAVARLVRHQGNVYGVDAPCGTTLSSAVSGTTATTTTLTATVTNGASGTGYWIAIIDGGTPPTDVQVQAGVSYPGATVVADGSGALMPGQSSTTFNVNGLSANTAYSVYFVARDGADNFSSVVGPRNITTSDAPVPVMLTPVPTLSAWALLLMSSLLSAVALMVLRQRRTQGS
ncbi:Lcl C-terminal domain-containing protein [Halopseudomonas salegens]|uniref:IPTL-CTERM protein sorting domain-containing protein n=1 Tax=Halopseudomonas salegens TaxID=1434072 RepID=A0A1H2FUW7_9GAMM|nr:DUF1566 domain-containing protein [Halopseudomonas salegens]SDU10808.1 IPTL-CTERM protein sorting domain-containing protein [Halopseudomonas salegens]